MPTPVKYILIALLTIGALEGAVWIELQYWIANPPPQPITLSTAATGY